ncbi:MAG: tRNA adenosine(34) deaminase TadA [Candidatus Binatia bacterium]
MINCETDIDGSHMRLALEEARKAAEKGEVPVGAIMARAGEVIGRGHNQRETLRSPLAHAEILAIQQASSRLRTWRLSECDLYVTLEPCVMCVGAILQARIRRLVFGCLDAKAGAVESLFGLCDDSRLNHRLPATGGLLACESADLLARFFKALREAKKLPSAERWPSPAEGA